MTRPPFLKEGDIVAIIATARRVSKAEVEYVNNFRKLNTENKNRHKPSIILSEHFGE